MKSLVILFFVLFTGLVGVITFLKTRNDNLQSKDGYFLGGRSLTGKVIAGSLLLTNLSAVSFIGMNGQAFSGNMSIMGWEVGSGITLVLVAIFLLPRYLKQGITTIPEFIESRFDKGTKMFVTILFLISYIVNMLPVTLYTGASALSAIFNIPGMFGITDVQAIWLMVWVLGIIGSIYAIFGGLKAVAISDSINGVALLIGGLLVPVFALFAIGGGNFADGLNIFLNFAPEKFDAFNNGGALNEATSNPLPISTMFTGLLLVNLYYWGTDQSIIQRGLGAKNLKEGQKGVLYAGFLKVLTPFIVIVPGLMAFVYFSNDASQATNLSYLINNTDSAYSYLVNAVLPDWLLGFFAAAMMGAVLSTFNSVLNSASTLFAVDIYKPLWGKKLSDKELVKKGKIFGTVVAVLGMIVAPFLMNAGGIFNYLQTINGFFNVPIFAIIFMGYVTKRTSATASKWGLATFVTLYAATQLPALFGGPSFPLHYLHVSAILFVISCSEMLIISHFKPREEEFILPNNNVVDILPWKNRFRFGAVVIFVMLGAYVFCSKIGLAHDGGVYWLTWLVLGLIAVGSALSAYFLEKKYNPLYDFSKEGEEFISEADKERLGKK